MVKLALYYSKLFMWDYVFGWSGLKFYDDNVGILRMSSLLFGHIYNYYSS